MVTHRFDPDGSRRQARHNIRVSVAVMTHPRRLGSAQNIASSVDSGSVQVVTDPDPSGVPTAWRTACRAWSSAPSDATHHLVLQDDVQLSSRFMERVRTAIEREPHAALSFFAEWGSRTASAIRIGLLSESAWSPVLDDYIPTQALVLPVDVANGFEEYARKFTTEVDPDDVVMLEYLRSSRTPMAVSTHNLVEHDVVQSIVGNNEQGARCATNFALDSIEHEFAGGHLSIKSAPFISWSTRELSLLTPPSDGNIWQKKPLKETIEEALGLRFDQVDAAARAALDVSDLPRSSQGVTSVHAWSLCVSAVISGFLSQGDALTDDIAWRSMKTIAGGALRKIVHGEDLELINTSLAPALIDAVKIGRTIR